MGEGAAALFIALGAVGTAITLSRTPRPPRDPQKAEKALCAAITRQIRDSFCTELSHPSPQGLEQWIQYENYGIFCHDETGIRLLEYLVHQTTAEIAQEYAVEWTASAPQREYGRIFIYIRLTPNTKPVAPH